MSVTSNNNRADLVNRFFRGLVQASELVYSALKHLEQESNANQYGRQIIAEMSLDYESEKLLILEEEDPIAALPRKRNRLFTQPIELIDRICYFLLSPRDLLSLSLTSKAAQSVIIPRHLDFRILRSDVRWKNIWDTLLGNPGTAARFASLVILAEATKYTVPRSMFTPEDLEGVMTRSWEAPSIHRLTQLTRYMSGLTKFHWLDQSIRVTDYPDFLAAVRDSCSALVDVQIHNKRILEQPEFFEDEPPPIDAVALKKIKGSVASCPLWDLRDLIRFSYTSHGDSMGADYSKMYDMLVHRCPRLEDLKLYNHVPMLAPIFARATWPRLKRLAIRGRSWRALDQDTWDDFCLRHPRIECIHIEGPFLLSLSAKHLPSLRSIHIGMDSFYKRVSPQLAAQLINLSLVVDVPRGRDFGELPMMQGLKHLLVVGRSVPKECLDAIAHAVPNVRKLALVSAAGGHATAFKKHDLVDENGYFVTILGFISHFSQLTHFSRLTLSTTCDPTICPFFKEVLDRIAGISPSLRYLNILNPSSGDMQAGKGGRWLKLERYPRERPGAYVQWSGVGEAEGAGFGGLFEGRGP